MRTPRRAEIKTKKTGRRGGDKPTLDRKGLLSGIAQMGEHLLNKLKVQVSRRKASRLLNLKRLGCKDERTEHGYTVNVPGRVRFPVIVGSSRASRPGGAR